MTTPFDGYAIPLVDPRRAHSNPSSTTFLAIEVHHLEKLGLVSEDIVGGPSRLVGTFPSAVRSCFLSSASRGSVDSFSRLAYPLRADDVEVATQGSATAGGLAGGAGAGGAGAGVVGGGGVVGALGPTVTGAAGFFCGGAAAATCSSARMTFADESLDFGNCPGAEFAIVRPSAIQSPAFGLTS